MTIPAKILWLVLLVTGLVLCSQINVHGQSSPPPLPKVMAVHRKVRITQTTQGAGAAALIAKAAIVIPPVARTNVMAWRYPSTINPNALWWNLEASTNMRQWSLVQSNATGSLTVTNNRAERMRVFRLVGRVNP